MGYGCITAMKFHPDNPSFIYTSAVDGRFCLQDFEGRQSQVYLDTMEISYWWCSFDISWNHGLIVVGDNHGNAALLDSDGQSIGTYKRLHKEKIKHLEFCPARPWMMATASVDRTVALWDVRMLKEGVMKGSPLVKSPKPVTVMKHGGPVTSCYFDPVHGNRLLTTAQNEEIRVYDSHDGWEEPTVTVNHPHRHFQHMTDIRATWHPLYADLCVIGRYPRKEDDDKTRSVDLIDLVSGQRVGYFYSPRLSNIIQVPHPKSSLLMVFAILLVSVWVPYCSRNVLWKKNNFVLCLLKPFDLLVNKAYVHCFCSTCRYTSLSNIHPISGVIT
jgi:DNA damage-binding protein 2